MSLTPISEKITEYIDCTSGEAAEPLPGFIQEKLINGLFQQPIRYGNEYGHKTLIHSYLDSLGPSASSFSGNNVLITSGAKEAIFLICSVLLNNYDIVLCPKPSWPGFLNILKLLKVHVCFYDPCNLDELNRSIHRIRPKLLILNYPNNPLCFNIDRNTELEVLNTSASLGVYTIFDKTLRTYQDNKSYFHNLPGLFYVDSMSKWFSLPGLRIGFIIANKSGIQTLAKYKDTTLSCAPVATQLIAEAILTHQQSEQWLKDNRTKYHDILDCTKILLLNSGIEIHNSNNIYFWCEGGIDQLSDSNFISLYGHLIKVLPGINFGANSGFRLCPLQTGDFFRETFAKIYNR